MLGVGLLLLAIVYFFTHRYYYALLIFFGFVTNGYQLIPPAILMAGAPTDKLTDLALTFLLVTLATRARTLWLAIKHEKIFWWISLFVLFILLDGIYSVTEQGYEINGVLRVFRTNLFLVSFGIFLIVPTTVINRLFHTIALITVFQSIVFLLQIPLNQTLLNSTMAGSEVATTAVDKSSFIRFYNTPIFLTPVLFYFLFAFRYKSVFRQRLILFILLLTVMAPLHRTYIFSVLVTITVYILFKQSFSQRAIYLTMLVLVSYGISMIDVVNSRLGEGFGDLQKTLTSDQSLANTDYGNNTFAYRMAHLFERINFITAKPSSYIFGIGLLSEDTKQAEKLSFEVGAYDERIGRKAQVNTGDIAWSLLILQLGFIGTLLFIIVIVKSIRLFYRHRSFPMALTGLLTLSVGVLISFTSTELLMIPFRTLLVLMTVVVVKEASTLSTHRRRQSSYAEVNEPVVLNRILKPASAI